MCGRRGAHRGRSGDDHVALAQAGVASISGRSWVMPLRLPPVSVTASGVPPSVITWCFELVRTRSTGLGSVLPLPVNARTCEPSTAARDPSISLAALSLANSSSCSCCYTSASCASCPVAGTPTECPCTARTRCWATPTSCQTITGPARSNRLQDHSVVPVLDRWREWSRYGA